MTALIETLDTPDGPFTLLVDEEGRVLASGWTDSHDEIVARLRVPHRPTDVAEGESDAAAAVRAYYSGDVAAIGAVRVRQFGTPLQQAGWEMLRRIAPGQPWTYTRFAAELGRPTAVRAAASVCAQNAPALFVPCHRVLRSDGSMGGFAWGSRVKAALLDRERGGGVLAETPAMTDHSFTPGT